MTGSWWVSSMTSGQFDAGIERHWLTIKPCSPTPFTRLPGENFADGLTTANLGTPSYELILKQHQAYRQALLSLGLDVVVLPAEPDYPDAYFVEDPAIITPNIAVMTRPGAPSRQGEGSHPRALPGILPPHFPYPPSRGRWMGETC